MTLHYAEIQNGETLSYRKRVGGKETLVLIHGNMTSSKHWDLLMDALPERYTIYAPDLRGFGESTYHERIQSIQDFSQDIGDWAKHLQLDSFYLMGWSLGGAVTMQFTIDYPEKVKKLVLLASASSQGYPFEQYLDMNDLSKTKRLTTLEEIAADPLRTQHIQGLYDRQDREGLKTVWNAGIYTHHQPSPDRYDAYVDDMLTQRNLVDVYHALNTFNISNTPNEAAQGTGEVSSIHVPVLIVSGDRDLIVPKGMTDELVSDFQGRANHVELQNTGHSPLVDRLDELVATVDGFLKGDE